MSIVRLSLIAWIVMADLPMSLAAQTFDVNADPIRYHDSSPNNAVSRL
jgi:hypothetical protein